MSRKITIEFLGDAKHLDKTIDGIQGKTSSIGDKMAKFGKAAAVGFALAGGAAVAGGKYFFDVGSKLEQMGMKAETVFGGQLGSVEKWAKANAHAMGLTTREATGLAANFADLLIPMGFTRKAAAGMSTDVVGLSGALSQWSGGTVSAAEASDVLAKAMLGERDGLKALGISISEADVKAELLRKGQGKLTGAALAQAEAQATQTLIMNKSKDAQAAFAAGGSPLLTAQAKLKAQFGEVRDVLAVKLLPMFGKLASWAVDEGLPALKKLGDWLGDKLGPVFEKVGDFVTKTVVPAFKTLIEKFTGASDGTSKVSKALKDAEPFFRLVAGVAKGLAKVWKEVLFPINMKLAEVALPAIGKALGAVGTAGTWLWNNALQPVFKLILGAVANILDNWARMLRVMSNIPGFGWAGRAADAMSGAADKARDLAHDIRKIPHKKPVSITADTGSARASLEAFIRDASGRMISIPVRAHGIGVTGKAHGGPVRRGRPYLVGEHEPELFVPESSGRILNQRQMRAAGVSGGSAGGGGDVYITVTGALDPNAVAQQIQKHLLGLKRRNGGLALGLA